MMWLSNWKIGNQLEGGDEVNVSVFLWAVMQLKEIGVHVVYEQEEKGSQYNTYLSCQNVIDDEDLSAYQDSLILATINASLTEDVLTQVMSYPTSREVWLALERTFSFISRAKAIQIRTQLANAKKGALSANAYFLSIKRMADELALAGQPLKANDIITYVLAGLGQEYDSLASTITSRSDPVTLEELYSLLLICESRINHNNQSLHAAASVNLATKQPQQQSQSPFRTAANFQPSNRGRGGYRGRGRGGRFNSRDQGPSNSVICQVCFKPGHTARKCYHRFNLSYQDQPTPQH
ncbi:hypothetical protein F0562_029116 [Nyssa sinensis]|uniref:CCHC-type domain-containing protein n=1 Tax=Nyssa sinensis TaxID=561372 RepID=A0A5J5B1Z7_9ASTE|nr:hypothetical protein F0562_029116 [Nyssa sinensis]